MCDIVLHIEEQLRAETRLNTNATFCSATNIAFSKIVRKTSLKYKIVHFLPVFGCLGDSAWNCIPSVYSVVMGLSFLF